MTTTNSTAEELLAELEWATERWESPVPLTRAECWRFHQLWTAPRTVRTKQANGHSVLRTLTDLLGMDHGQEYLEWRQVSR